MGAEAIFALDLDDLGVAEAEEVEGSADGAGVDRVPKPIQDEHGQFEDGCHKLFRTIARKLAEPFLRATRKARAVRFVFLLSCGWGVVGLHRAHAVI